MTQPTHTHATHGGRHAYIGELNGGKVYDSATLVIYHDLDKNITSHVVESEWRQNWKDIESDDCPVCLGAGHDQFKGNKDKPCGGCYGLGKVLETGDAAKEMWELATVASTIITRQEHELRNLRRIAQNPAVQALIEQQRQHAIDESTARQEQEWRRGKGFGPGGQRVTGD
jgi:hypothetical protein